MGNKVMLYIRTIKDLKLIQIRHQVIRKLALKDKRVKKYNMPSIRNYKRISVLIEELDLDVAYLERFNLDGLMNNQVELLHEMHKISTKWQVSEASHLWNYNLHYLEYLIRIAVEYKATKEEKYYSKWKEYLIFWLENVSKDSFEPYTISLRIPNVLICMELLEDRLYSDSEFVEKINRSLYQQYKHLLKNQELSLLANHYFENLKTIVISSIYFNETAVFEKYWKIIRKEMDEQILDDGMHFERSLMYHKIILEDLLRIYTVLKSVGKNDCAKEVVLYIEKMTYALEGIEKGFERTPLFNDAGDNVAKKRQQLLTAVVNKLKIKKENAYLKTEWANAGYYRLDSGDINLLIDCGEIGPRYMSGHAHNDVLSFELAKDGKMLFVNAGTGQYQGKLRKFYRSTMAHNTCMVDDREQSELWGEHRAARKVNCIAVNKLENKLKGEYLSYSGDFFQRSFYWKSGNELDIVDSVTVPDNKEHILHSFWHIAPDYVYDTNTKNGVDIKDRITGQCIASMEIPLGIESVIHRNDEQCYYAEEFGLCSKIEVLELKRMFAGKVSNEIKIVFKGE